MPVHKANAGSRIKTRLSISISNTSAGEIEIWTIRQDMISHGRDLGTLEGEWDMDALDASFWNSRKTIDVVESRRESIARRIGGFI
jgi:hypothetical protein